MLDLTIHAVVGKKYVAYLRRKLLRAHPLLRTSLRELSVALTNEKVMRGLHRKFMGLDKPTDVLTFPLELDKRKRPVSGEVLICVPEAERQAKRLGTDTRDELLLYALHGMLHLSGFDDRTESDFRRMHRKEDEILARIGVGPVFHRQPAKRKPRKRGRTS